MPRRPPAKILDDLIEQAGDDLQCLADELGGREVLAALSPSPDGLRGDMLLCPGCGPPTPRMTPAPS